MAATVLETLSREDLRRWRAAAATTELVQVPGHDLSGEEVRQCWLDYWQLYGELLEEYGIWGEEAADARISLATGQIVIGVD